MLEELTREYSHPFGIAAAHTLDAVLGDPKGFPSRVAGIADALPAWPKLRVSREAAARVRNGTRLAYAPESLGMTPFVPGLKALLLEEDGEALALAETALDNEGLKVWSTLRGLWK